MRKFLLFATFFAASLAVNAQNEVGKLTFMPKVGVNLSTLSGDDQYYVNDKLESKYRIGVVAGIEGEYQLSNPLSLSVGVLYSLQGNKYDDVTYRRNYTSTFHGVNVPVMLNFYVIKGLAVKAGLQAGYAFNKKESYDLFVDKAWGSFASSGSIYNSFDIGVPVGVSYDFDKLRLDLRYNYGLTNISKLDGMPATHHRVIQLSLGYILK